MNKIDTLREKVKNLMSKPPFDNPWIIIIARWFLVIIISVFAIILLIHGVRTSINNKAQEIAARAIAEYEEEQAIKEQERQAILLAESESQQTKKEREINLISQVLAGINNFVESYNYSDNDLRTYAECVINRVYHNSDGFGNNITDVVLQKDQWTGFNENNQIIERYYKIAKTVVENYYANKPRPCSDDFCWAELRRNGIWLKNEYSDSKYVSTWRYTG